MRGSLLAIQTVAQQKSLTQNNSSVNRFKTNSDSDFGSHKMDDSLTELDSFTEEIIRRNKERQKLLNDSIVVPSDSGEDQSDLSQSSIEVHTNVLRNSSQTNIEPIRAEVEVQRVEPAVDFKTKQIVENLQKLSPTRKRVPLSQRLNSIARTLEDTENFGFIDDCSSTSAAVNTRREEPKAKSPVKAMKDSPPKKRPLLNERLNHLARNCGDEFEFQMSKPSPKPDTPKPSQSKYNRSPVKAMRQQEPIRSPAKEQKEVNVSPVKKSPRIESTSPVKPLKQMVESPTKTLVSTTSNRSPVKPVAQKSVQSVRNEKQESVPRKILEVKRQKSPEKQTNREPIVLSNKVSKMRQMFEEKLSYETNTATMTKKDVERRRKEMLDSLSQSSPKPISSPLTPNCSPPKKRQLLTEEQPDNIEAETSNDNNEELANESVASINNDIAHQTVCDAFEEIENYSFGEEIDDNLNNSVDFINTESKAFIDKDLNIESPTKRLYPVLDLNPDMASEPSDAPPKPPRLHTDTEEVVSTPSTPLRTISFYRKEKLAQNQSRTPTVVLAVQRPSGESSKEVNHKERNRRIRSEITELKREVEDTNRVAGQASIALNLCLERNEFKSSSERVEAEKLLLLAGMKRITFLNEIKRLEDLIDKRDPETSITLGTLVLRDLKLKIRRDFMVNKRMGNKSHHLLCIITCGAKVLVTNVISSESLPLDNVDDTYAEFQFGVSLNELAANFKVNIYLYDLVTHDKELPHDLKYHIKKTPKKNKNLMKSPAIRSPGGPDIVRTSSFKLVGKVVIGLNNYQSKYYKLDNFDMKCLLEGGLEARAELTVCHNFNKQGFFDVRETTCYYNMRWVVLKGHHIAIYRFPEDVETKAPLFKVDLKNVVNPRVELVPSHLRHTARCNSIALVIVDPQHKSKNIFTKGGSLPRSPPKKFLMSGESREIAVEWAQELTRALADIRLWSADAVKPYHNDEFEKLLVALD